MSGIIFAIMLVFIIVFLILWYLLFYMFLGLNITIHLFYGNFLSLYNIMIVCLVFSLWFSVAYYLYNKKTREETTELIKYLVDKDTEQSMLNALVLRETYNLMTSLLGFIFILAIIVALLFSINDETISSGILALYFGNIFAIFLTFQLILDSVKENIEKKKL